MYKITSNTTIELLIYIAVVTCKSISYIETMLFVKQ